MELLDGNDEHVRGLADSWFEHLRDGQRPRAVSMCCSDSRVSQELMWSVDEPGWLFTPSTIGNQVWDRVDGRLVVDGSVLYPMEYAETEVVVVVGHTGCAALTAAFEAVENETEHPVGVSKWVELLVPVVEDALDAGVVEGSEEDVVHRLVEHNVDRQVEFLLESDDVSDDVSVYGFVYDLHLAYGDVDGRAYLVNADGERDVDVLRDLVPDEQVCSVVRLNVV
ncbi:MAG: carbonic anhydrase [Halobacteriales archaeon]